MSMLCLLVALGFRIILLRGKLPISRNGHHWVTTDPDEIRRHHGNVGIMAGAHAVIDFDLVRAMADMTTVLGPLQPTVETGSGKLHCYVAHVPGLPRYFSWRGEKVGEIVRLPTEYAVCPPSLHPDTRRPYQWLVDPREPLPTLPEAWRTYLLDAQTGDKRPSFIAEGDRTGVDFEDETTWDGPSSEELLRRARQQPGARERSSGVKFQCPGCRAEGHDRHQDNACVFLDGRWGCAVDSAHSRAIGEALGVVTAEPVPTPQGYDARVLRRLGLRL